MAATFVSNQLPIELPGVYPGTGTYAARIRRFDGLIYDPADRTFKSSPTSSFIPLQAGTNDDQTIRTAFVPLDKKNWLDGDYLVYFHDTSTPLNMVISESLIQIWNGSWASVKPVTPTDIALRMFSVTTASHKTPGSYGGDHLVMMRQLAYICQYIQSVTGKPYPTSPTS